MRTNRITSILIVLFMMLGLMFNFDSSGAYADSRVSIYIDGVYLSTDVDPYIKNDRVMLPVASIAKALGASVEWDGDNKIVSSEYGDVEIEMKIHS